MSSSASRGLFPTLEDLDPGRKNESLPRVKAKYSSYAELLQTHVDLLTEDFISALSEQVNNLRANPSLLDSSACYTVTGRYVHQERSKQAGLEFTFNPSRYNHVKWEEERRFLTGNLVLLTQSNLKDFIVGVVHDSRPQQLRQGRVVIKLIRGVNEDGSFWSCDHEPYVKQTFKLIESQPFFFPCLHVTSVLRKDLADPFRTLANLEAEVVHGVLPSRPPKYSSYLRSVTQTSEEVEALKKRFRTELNESQMDALEKALVCRVALVQGPPGTGKTFLGSRLIHGYSDKHDRADYGPLQQRYNVARTRTRTELMKGADVLAMTTTRAAYMRPTLDSLDIKIVIVEEAGEALEGYVLASLPFSTEHLIQIGDHRQLRPSCENPLLGASHGLDLSLFERLIRNGADCPMLNEQRRMRPAIARLVSGPGGVYPDLRNHPTTEDRPRIAGVDLDDAVFMVDHESPETQDGKGYHNDLEADFAAELGNYFLLQGYSPEEITILTTYRRQLFLILQRIRSIGGDATRIRVTTVDNFQGEENKIIILSLVRSNTSGSIGFLKLENRACVALSRARDGFFILGHLSCLKASGTQIWKHVAEVLSTTAAVGTALPLLCSHGKKFLAKSGSGVRTAGEGCVVCQVRATVTAAEKKSASLSAELEEVEAEAESAPLGSPQQRQRQRDAQRIRGELQEVSSKVERARAKFCRVEALLQRGGVNVEADTMETLERRLLSDTDGLVRGLVGLRVQ
ncbi:uncharacterized protein LOC113214661 [Frankliniella occidentalis]|uniref:Uncharacterized protein LOC113214661 n=1 Tax=Frankliniella occidentalis TaxID=133901 RepID=A0A9C6XRR7_FRAOC|nr:uncharacterized protein LOC113214661 [Frankliniella occidentalis]